VAEPKADVTLVFELSEALEFEPPRDDPEVEVVAALLLREALEGVAAMGAETLVVWEGSGKAIVTPWFGGSFWMNCALTASYGATETPDPLCLAVAGEMRTVP